MHTEPYQSDPARLREALRALPIWLTITSRFCAGDWKTVRDPIPKKTRPSGPTSAALASTGVPVDESSHGASGAADEAGGAKEEEPPSTAPLGQYGSGPVVVRTSAIDHRADQGSGRATQP